MKITTRQLENDLITMQKQGLIRKAGYQYNRTGEPEQRFDLTHAGNEKFWQFEFEHLSDEDRATLERCDYEVTAQGLQQYVEEQ